MKRRTHAETIERIAALKRERDAIALVHNYQLGEVQDIADFVGDSLELSYKARDNQAGTIVFCGVRFMAETAKILSPAKTVLLPVPEAGCPMADMATAAAVREMKAARPDALVVTYVNSSAEVKAEADVCVTSANALKIVSLLPRDREVIFVPDKNLGAYIARETGRALTLWDGFCPTHARVTAEMVRARAKEFPDAKILVHPECSLDVIDLADAVESTGGMVAYARKTKDAKLIVVTEIGMVRRLREENPNIQYILVSEEAVCPYMKLIRLEDILSSLETLTTRIEIPEDIRVRALKPIARMLEMSR